MQLVSITILGMALLSIFLLFARFNNIRNTLEGILQTYIIAFLFVLVTTEVLSLLDKIDFGGVLACWGAVTFMSVITAAIRLKHYKCECHVEMPTRSVIITLVVITFIVCSTLLSALLYPPNNWDSMTYHMSRIVHWIDNKNLDFYPTSISRQLYQMPLAEYVILHLQIITQSDKLANLIQWTSFVVVIITSYLVALEFKLDKQQQYITIIIVSTLPMLILQSSSTQNDVVVSCFILSFALYMLRLNREATFSNIFFSGISLGLALMTKGTAYVYCAAIGSAISMHILVNNARSCKMLVKSFAFLVIVCILGLILNLGHLTRNYNLYGNPFSTETEKYKNKKLTTTVIISNVLRNGALHLISPYAIMNQNVESSLAFLLGHNLYDPDTTWRQEKFPKTFVRHEDYSGNFVHILIVVAAAVVLPLLWYKGKYRSLIWYSSGVLASAVLYCSLFKWQPWASRLHTPMFVLSAPLLAITVTALPTKRSIFINIIIAVLIIYSIQFAIANATRSLISLEWYRTDRSSLYLVNRKELLDDYASVVNYLATQKVDKVGLYMGRDSAEYPLWVLAKRAYHDMPFRFFHVGVDNISGSLTRKDPMPLLVVSTRSDSIWLDENGYQKTFVAGKTSVFKKNEK